MKGVWNVVCLTKQPASRIHDKHGGVLEGIIGFGSFSSLTHLLGCGFGGKSTSLNKYNPTPDFIVGGRFVFDLHLLLSPLVGGEATTVLFGQLKY